MPAITATIITFNEEDRIGEAIASLSCCDEVIVVDSGSTDRTREIASSRGARVIEHAWEGYSRQKNLAAEHAANDWILSLDADERLSIELAGAIAQWKSAPHTDVAALSMPRRAFYMGRWIRHSGWYPDRKVRLYNRRCCRWDNSVVHEGLTVNGRLSALTGDILHFPFRSWNDQLERANRYIELVTKDRRSSGSRGSVLKLLVAPPVVFMKAFFFRAGFLDGWRGLVIAYMAARYVFLREFRILR
jgi:glycosyltransferase involved in cell wall biosynthesis